MGGEADQYQAPQPQSTAGMRTSDFYEVHNIPERFNHPGKTSGFNGNKHLEFVLLFPNIEWFEGYNTKPQHPFYAPSSSVYG